MHIFNCIGIALHDSHFKVILNHFILGPNAALQSPLTLSLLSLQAGFFQLAAPLKPKVGGTSVPCIQICVTQTHSSFFFNPK